MHVRRIFRCQLPSSLRMRRVRARGCFTRGKERHRQLNHHDVARYGTTRTRQKELHRARSPQVGARRRHGNHLPPAGWTTPARNHLVNIIVRIPEIVLRGSELLWLIAPERVPTPSAYSRAGLLRMRTTPPPPPVRTADQLHSVAAEKSRRRICAPVGMRISYKPQILVVLVVIMLCAKDALMDATVQGAGEASKDGSFDVELKAKAAEEGMVSSDEEREEDKKLIPDYNLGEPIKDWNRKRKEWAEEHPEVKQEQLFIVTGTQPFPCRDPEGDHLLLRCFKNKVDYGRIHGAGLFYNTALLDTHMPSFWAKGPVVRATMLAHPEVEWIWWLDADAIITDMEFSIPWHRYAAYNLVVHGWESVVFEKRSWLGLNAGSFLLRNCQWSLDLLERWASMGPKAPMGDAYSQILSDFLPDRPRSPTDDQSALVYFLIKERQRWAGKLRVELENFYLSGYWLELMDTFEATENRYRAMEQKHAELWEMLEREGAVGKEKLIAAVSRAREQHLSASGTTVQQRRPFVTHFTGCQPCSGHHNPIYTKDQCRNGLLRALNFADDQVLGTLGYQHRTLLFPDLLPRTP